MVAILLLRQVMQVFSLVGVELVVWRDEMGLCWGGFTTYACWLEGGYQELPLGEWTDVSIPGEDESDEDESDERDLGDIIREAEENE